MDAELQLGTTPEELVENFTKSETRFPAYMALQELGAEYVLLDTKRNSPTADSARHHEEAWRILTTLAEKVLDLERETVR